MNLELIRREAFKAGWYAGHAGKSLDSIEYYIKKFDKPERLIFLDIDGVLNNSNKSDPHTEIPGEGFYSKSRVAILNTLIADTGANVVVSSTWRLGRSVSDLQSLLDTMGINGAVIGITPDKSSEGCLRGNEIYQWLKDNMPTDFRRYVILDDDTDILYWQRDNYVNCDPEIGLSERGMYRAKSILLNAPCEDVGQEYYK